MFVNKQAQNRCYTATFFALQKSYCPRFARLVAVPQPTLVLALARRTILYVSTLNLYYS